MQFICFYLLFTNCFFFFFCGILVLEFSTKGKKVENNIIDYTLGCIDKENCLPTTNKVAQALGISIKEVDAFKQKDTQYKEIVTLRKRFNSFDKKRKEGFKSFVNFYRWYVSQKKECHYCGATQEQLDRLFDDELIISSKFNATLHIEQKTPKQGYSENNCVLACALCNNAKSDMINEENFKTYFADSMRTFISDLLSGKIANDVSG